MIKGMTGFGTSQFSSTDTKGIVEIKSLNHRYFDINYYLPIGFGSIENKIRQLVSRHVERGRVTVSVKIIQKPISTPKFNKDTIRKYIRHSKNLKKEFGLKNDLSLPDLVKLPGVIETAEKVVEAEQIWTAIEKSLRIALRSLVMMRKREGRSLTVDVQNQLKKMAIRVRKIKMRAQVIIREKKKTLTQEEFVAFQRNDDVNEEISRLSHYIDELKILIRSSVPIGKKIDFVAQEMQRETNTIGSKLQDKIVSNAVIALKSKIEKIREQSQNIE